MYMAHSILELSLNFVSILKKKLNYKTFFGSFVEFSEKHLRYNSHMQTIRFIYGKLLHGLINVLWILKSFREITKKASCKFAKLLEC